MPCPQDYILVYVTAASPEEAERIGTALVREKLAACANILPVVTSVYVWQGRLERSAETLCLLKTRRENFCRLEARVKALHSYEVPCITAVPLVEGSAPYLRWIDEACNSSL